MDDHPYPLDKQPSYTERSHSDPGVKIPARKSVFAALDKLVWWPYQMETPHLISEYVV
jgi:hypothetical protein